MLGATAAQSKSNFIDWVDNLISSVATEDCKVYALSGARQYGSFTNLSSLKLLKVMAKFTKLQAWTADILNNSYSCGCFVVTIVIEEARGRVSHQGIFVGPFQT